MLNGQLEIALPTFSLPDRVLSRRVRGGVQSGEQLVSVLGPARDRIRLLRVMRFASSVQCDEYQTLAALPLLSLSRAQEPGEDGRRAHVPGNGRGGRSQRRWALLAGKG